MSFGETAIGEVAIGELVEVAAEADASEGVLRVLRLAQRYVAVAPSRVHSLLLEQRVVTYVVPG